ncbi:DUF6484 domain-containing protein [Desulfoluna sp.]|uniref:DUF6484 domain-containing protein n=1 Tax=Desulfoluna sp. TaxID=2045199 RepID=UPI00260D7946|nr:DUF6484 domain-containing protein [Desulfoluna sp.]
MEELVTVSVSGNCVGHIVGMEREDNAVFVDYEGNPSKKPVIAKLGRPFMLKDLQNAIARSLDVRLDFENHDPGRPVVTNIYYSILDSNDEAEKDLSTKEIRVHGKRIVIEAETEIVIRSGEASTTYTAKNGRLVSEGVEILSEALHANKIKGASIALN